MSCDVQAAGSIELYFYGELPHASRLSVQAHLRQCAECRRALEDLVLIREALAAAPDVAGPPGGDWSRVTAGIDAAVRPAADDVPGRLDGVPFSWRRRAAPYLALAAALVLVTLGALMVIRSQAVPADRPDHAAADDAPTAAMPAADPALLAASGQHFQRSKLVVLGLATRDTAEAAGESWGHERALATNLLHDTRLYRRAAESRGMSALAGVMRDLEMVLLQTSMSEDPDGASLERIQRLIRQRDLLTKMVVYEGSSPSGL